VKSPFSGNGFTQGDTLTGSFVYDVQLVPGPATGSVNVFYSNFPDIAAIPDADAFNLTLNSLNFNLGHAVIQYGIQEAAVQYTGGAFNGFFYVANFTFQSNLYQFEIQGRTFDIQAINPSGYPTGDNLISGYINQELSNVSPYQLAAVPEPETYSMLVAGLGLLGFVARRRRQNQA
jgi:hypothetical protein